MPSGWQCLGSTIPCAVFQARVGSAVKYDSINCKIYEASKIPSVPSSHPPSPLTFQFRILCFSATSSFFLRSIIFRSDSC